MLSKLGRLLGSTDLHYSTISARLTSIYAIEWSFNFSPFITLCDISYASRPSKGTSLFNISHNKHPKAKISTV